MITGVPAPSLLLPLSRGDLLHPQGGSRGPAGRGEGPFRAAPGTARPRLFLGARYGFASGD